MIDYDFDINSQLIINGETIPHGDLAEILDKYFDGLCPACNEGVEINQWQIICNDCFERAQSYRCDGPPLPSTYTAAAAGGRGDDDA